MKKYRPRKKCMFEEKERFSYSKIPDRNAVTFAEAMEALSKDMDLLIAGLADAGIRL